MIEDEAALLSDIRFPLRGLNPWPPKASVRPSEEYAEAALSAYDRRTARGYERLCHDAGLPRFLLDFRKHEVLRRRLLEPRLERFRNLGCDAVRSRTRERRHAGYHPFSTQLGEADLLVGSCSAATRSGSSSPPMGRKVPSSLSQKKSITAKLVFACR
jgi:hypothetical protein